MSKVLILYEITIDLMQEVGIGALSTVHCHRRTVNGTAVGSRFVVESFPTQKPSSRTVRATRIVNVQVHS